VKSLRRTVARIAVIGVVIFPIASGVALALGTVRANYVFMSVPVRDPVIALTFDDGPDPEHTIPMLDDLKARGVAATFFVVGEEAEKHFDILERIVADGHEVGNHTYTHSHVEHLDAKAFAAEIDRCDATIMRATDAVTWYRPPRGRLSLEQEWSIVGGGKRVAGWNRCLEASEFRDPFLLAAALEPGDIVLVHDGRLDRSKSVEMLPDFLDAALARGFVFVTLSELDSMRVPRLSTGVIPGGF